MEKAEMLKKLYHSEVQFKLALAVSANCACSDGRALNYLGVFSYGKHVMDTEELSLTSKEEKMASVILEHSATYMMVLQLDDILKKCFPVPLEHQDCCIRSGAQIIRLIRNAYAHDPLSPTWKIPLYCRDQTFKVEEIISLKTNGLDGKMLKRMDYGGGQ